MDPEACLNEAASSLRESGSRVECAKHLTNYFQWRLSGGFQPLNGDKRAMDLLMQLGLVADTLSGSLCVD